MGLCEPEPDAGLGPRSAMVIDVRQSRICCMPENARYLALSYCWPVGETFKLVRANLVELQRVGSLDSKIQQLPATIQDAIGFVRDLGETYLWVDSLCIVQDDDDDKQVQLNQMDRIYGSALVTLVCAPATLDPVAACGGLPCYRPGTRARRQVATEVKGLRLLIPFEAVISLQLLSRWSSRAWTYQELLLSRRLIFFTDTQVYFQCSVGIFCEDNCGEDVMREAHFCPASNLWNPGRPYVDQDAESFIDSMYIASYNTPPGRLISNYAQHVDEYTSRNLSLSSDILNAFVGIQNAMQFSMSSRFLYGLPLRYIDKCLLWTSPSPRRRRESIELPSWSWAGWDGPISMLSYLNIALVRSEAAWYLIDCNGTIIHFQVNDSPGMTSFPQPRNKVVSPVSLGKSEIVSATSTINRSHKEIISSSLLEPIRLACWSTTAQFRVDGSSASLKGLNLRWKESVNMRIFDKDGYWVGSTITDRALSEELLQQNQSRTVEFMLVSRSVSTRLASDRDTELFDTHTFEERSWCLLNVMMIDHRANDVIRRVTVGVIHEDAWALAQSKPALFKLE